LRVTRQSTTPALPAFHLQPETSERATQRIALRRSFAMRAALGIFVLTATSAAYACFASHLGTWRALPLTLAVAASLMLGARRHERAQPAALRFGRDELSVWDQAGTLLMQGRITGCSQWSSRLLILALQPEAGRARTLLIAADALPAPVFRQLSVLGRRAAGA
jgi:hypothetical protein